MTEPMETRQVFGSREVALANRFRPTYCARCASKLEEKLRYGEMRFVCPNCGFIADNTPGAAVAVVVVQDDRVLLCKRASYITWPGLWCLPAGGVQWDEDYLTAGLRETEEETGVRVEIEGVISVVSNFWKEGYSTLVPVLLAHPVSGTPVATDESQSVEWFKPDDLPDLAWEADRHIIQRYFANREPGLSVDLNYVSHSVAEGRVGPPPSSLHKR